MSSWYKNTRAGFLQDSIDEILGKLHGAAALDGWNIDPDQDEEWRESLLALRDALQGDELSFVEAVLTEFDFRRRGIRIDFILLAGESLIVLEFKRGALSAADRDQILNYCINLVEFHELTQAHQLSLFPILVSRRSRLPKAHIVVSWHRDWPRIFGQIVETSSSNLADTVASLSEVIHSAGKTVNYLDWDSSPFNPSSSIVDATISLYGQHDVSAIKTHSASKEDIDRCIEAVVKEIGAATNAGRNELILVSGAPGAGKTLVGLAITFHELFRGEAVFVTGNAPLVEVLNGSLQRSYCRLRSRSRSQVLGGYTRKSASFVERNTDFKIVKAHRFLDHARRRMNGNADRTLTSTDGRILVFDEAQRTYSSGTHVNRMALEEDESVLILKEMQRRPGAILVLLIGHNQHINTAEMGANAWLDAARELGWKFAVSDKTLALSDFSQTKGWAVDPLRITIDRTHLSVSMRDQGTRNGEIEKWADYVMTDKPEEAATVAANLPSGSEILITRDIRRARGWANAIRTGEQRCGIIASGQGRRLRPEGIFVDEKPDIVNWMLAPSGDVRSSNMLEQTQNQYQIQGLEIDYSIVCWDADMRREEGHWSCYNVIGPGWSRSKGEDEARSNSYRVLLTRSRKAMVIFVPRGDISGRDITRPPEFYDSIYEYLHQCGAVELAKDQTG